MGTVAILALVRDAIWAPLLYCAIRRRSPISIGLVLLAWASNWLLATGMLRLSGAIGIVAAPMIVLLLIDRLYRDPEHVKRVAALQVTEARREMHDARNDAMAAAARVHAAERALSQHGIKL